MTDDLKAKLAALDAKARDAMAAANLAAENRAGPDIMHPLMSENTLAHERLAAALVNAYRAGELVPRAELDEAVAEIARLKNPTWFYAAGSEEICFFDPSEVIDYIDPEDSMVVEIATARPCPSIWAAVVVNHGQDSDERLKITEHATEEAARAFLARHTQED